MTVPDPADAAIFEIDGRCLCGLCEGRTTDTYQMVGDCRNCRADATMLVTFRRGDDAHLVDCPACGCTRTVQPSRLATAADGAVYTDPEATRG